MPGSFPQGKDYSAQTIKRMGIRTALDVGPGVGTYAELFQMFQLPLEVFDCVEIWEPYVDKYGLRTKYSNVYVEDVRKWDNFDYDLVIFGDILEHMTKEEARAVWDKVAAQARYALISIPIVPLPQGEEEGNPFEAHIKDDWTPAEILDTFPHIARYRAYSALGIFIADFSFEGEPQEDHGAPLPRGHPPGPAQVP
jgi:hypothetical protein